MDALYLVVGNGIQGFIWDYGVEVWCSYFILKTQGSVQLCAKHLKFPQASVDVVSTQQFPESQNPCIYCLGEFKGLKGYLHSIVQLDTQSQSLYGRQGTNPFLNWKVWKAGCLSFGKTSW